MLALYQLPAAHEKECSITKSITECGNCCCCGDEEECCCEPENQSQNDDDISCICKINEAEPIEEQKDPVNLNLNFQKLTTILKSDFFSNTVDFENCESSNFIPIKNIPPSYKFEIYLIISNLRI